MGRSLTLTTEIDEEPNFGPFTVILLVGSRASEGNLLPFAMAEQGVVDEDGIIVRVHAQQREGQPGL